MDIPSSCIVGPSMNPAHAPWTWPLGGTWRGHHTVLCKLLTAARAPRFCLGSRLRRIVPIRCFIAKRFPEGKRRKLHKVKTQSIPINLGAI